MANHATQIEHSPVTPAEDARTIMVKGVSWAAVFAGVAVSLVTQLLLSMLGIGVGIATLDPGTGDNPEASTFSIAAALWWVASGILAAGLGGATAGRMSGRPSLITTGMHGLITWAFTTLIVAYMLSTAMGGVIGGAFKVIGSAVGGATQVAGETMRGGAQGAAQRYAGIPNPWEALQRDVRDASAGNDPAAMRDAAVNAVQALVTGDPAKANEARERAVQAVAKVQNISVEEARAKVTGYEQQYRQAADEAKARATEAAEVATKVLSRAALCAFLALGLGAIAGWFGGREGTVDPIVTDRATY